jgi:hypothetical protein
LNAAAWIALASLSAIVVTQLVAFAFMFGRLFERVKALEARKDGSDCTAALAALKATLEGLQQAMEHRIGSLEQTVSNLLMPKVTRARRAGGE